MFSNSIKHKVDYNVHPSANAPVHYVAFQNLFVSITFVSLGFSFMNAFDPCQAVLDKKKLKMLLNSSIEGEEQVDRGKKCPYGRKRGAAKSNVVYIKDSRRQAFTLGELDRAVEGP